MSICRMVLILDIHKSVESVPFFRPQYYAIELSENSMDVFQGTSGAPGLQGLAGDQVRLGKFIITGNMWLSFPAEGT